MYSAGQRSPSFRFNRNLFVDSTPRESLCHMWSRATSPAIKGGSEKREPVNEVALQCPSLTGEPTYFATIISVTVETEKNRKNL